MKDQVFHVRRGWVYYRRGWPVGMGSTPEDAFSNFKKKISALLIAMVP